MRPPKLTEHKVKHAIAKHGKVYVFERMLTDDYKQPQLDENGNQIFRPFLTVNGLFHETGTAFDMLLLDGATVSSKPKPMIMTLLADAADIRPKDIVSAGPGTVYTVVAVNDVGNLGMFADISLEVFLNGLPV